MRYFTIILLFILFLAPPKVHAQFYGNSVVNNTTYFLNAGYTFWFKIETGATDSGFFTHLGINKAGPSGYCRIALYGDHATSDRPHALLSMTATNGYELEDGFNEFPLATVITLAPSTTYWIAVKGSDAINCGRDDTQNWAYSPSKYKTSFYIDNWQNPVSFSGASTINNPKRAAIWAIGNNQTLPIELTDFAVASNDGKVTLNWQTASEVNNKGWNIQKSTNGFSWTSLDWMSSEGDTYAMNSYSYLDRNPAKGMNFYRLEQVDFNGKRSYSDIKSVSFQGKEGSVFPNPVTNLLKYTGFNEGSVFSFYNTSGDLVMTKVLQGQQSVDMTKLHTGVYFLKVEEGRKITNFRIIKE